MSYNNMKLTSEIARAILRGDEKMLMPDGTVIDIPAGQGAGTYYQKQTYANQKAIEVFNNIGK